MARGGCGESTRLAACRWLPLQRAPWIVVSKHVQLHRKVPWCWAIEVKQLCNMLCCCLIRLTGCQASGSEIAELSSQPYLGLCNDSCFPQSHPHSHVRCTPRTRAMQPRTTHVSRVQRIAARCQLRWSARVSYTPHRSASKQNILPHIHTLSACVHIAP